MLLPEVLVSTRWTPAPPICCVIELASESIPLYMASLVIEGDDNLMQGGATNMKN